MRYAAFFLGVAAGVFVLAGAIMGLGIAGIGFLFAAAGPLPLSMGVGFAMILAIAMIFTAVAIMFVRDARPLGLFLAVAFAVPGALFGMAAAVLAYRLDREKALV
ncbi:MAG: hypothetical protein MUF63_18120 [Rhodobacteraceae bacterium]|nr:hypothetical protein [Paracoccaceae bacterium]